MMNSHDSFYSCVPFLPYALYNVLVIVRGTHNGIYQVVSCGIMACVNEYCLSVLLNVTDGVIVQVKHT